MIVDPQAPSAEIYFAGGCFWGTEHFFKQVRGVTATEVGYANGNIKIPITKPFLLMLLVLPKPLRLSTIRILLIWIVDRIIL